MGRIIAYIRKATFVRNVAILASGTAIAQALTIASYPILMRLYDPADFGLFALLGAIIMTACVVASGKYEMAVVLERTEQGAANVLALSLGLVLLCAILSAAVLAVAGDSLMRLFGTERLTPLLPLVPLSVVVFAGYGVISFWSTREKAFTRMSISNVSRSFGVSVFQIVLGLFRAGPGGLILGQVLGQLVALLVLSWQTIRQDGRRLWGLIRWSEMRRLARAHREFPIFNAPRALMNSTTETAPAIMLTMFFGPHIAGLYWFAYRLLELPITLLGDATRRVFYQRAVELHHAGRGLTEVYVKASLGLAALAAVPGLVLILAAPPLFEFAFGPEWREAGAFMQWMVAWWLMKFASLPSTMLMPVLGLQRMYLVIEAVILVPRLAVIPLAAQFGDEIHAIASYSMVGLAYYLACSLLVLHHVRRNDARLREDLGSAQAA